MTSQLTPSRRAAVDALLNQNRQTIAAGGRGRLIFALDATASRQSTWDTANELQAAMFAEAGRFGGLQVQLVFFRGTECKATAWTTSPNDLAVKMRKITCVTGETQWGRVLAHVRREHQQKPVNVAVFVGDCCEEIPDALYDAATGLPKLIMVQENDNPIASVVFAELARRTGGEHFALGPDSARGLGEVLRAAAAYAVGGSKALEDQRTDAARKLLTNLR
jgi:hypothetical protein